jgi:hypothetical protein
VVTGGEQAGEAAVCRGSPAVVGEEFPKPLTAEVVDAADVVVTLGCGDACPVRPGRRSSRAAREHNMRLLDEATLCVAKFTGDSPAAEIDGTGKLPSDGEFNGTARGSPSRRATSPTSRG